MILKSHEIPINLLSLIAMGIRYDQPRIWQEAASYYSGYKGELSLDYYLKFINQTSNHILHNLRLPHIDSYYQLDSLLLNQSFFLDLEVKNHSNIIRFDHKNGIMYQRDKQYEDPVSQAQAQVYQFKSTLQELGVGNIPVEFLVVFTNPSVQLSEERDERIIYSHQLRQRIEYLSQKYQQPLLQKSELLSLANTLIEKNKPLQSDMFKLLGIPIQKLKNGVCCPKCLYLAMLRKHGFWFCPSCQYKSRTAHLRSFFEYQLLKSPFITNQQARRLLKLDSIKTTSRLLTNSPFPHHGTFRDRVYQINYDLQKDGKYLLDYYVIRNSN